MHPANSTNWTLSASLSCKLLLASSIDLISIIMSTSTQMTCSASSSGSSLSQTSLLSGTGKHKRDCKLISSRSTTLLGRSGGLSMAHLCTTLNPRDYLLPGVTSGTYVLHAIASVRIYYSAQLTSSNLNHFGALRIGGVGAKRKNNGNQWVYSHLKGTLVFGYNHYCAGVETTIAETTPASNNNNSNNNGEKAEANGGGREWWFQLVDDETDKVVWKFKLPLSPGYKFNYEFDRPFFHVFQGSVSVDFFPLTHPFLSTRIHISS